MISLLTLAAFQTLVDQQPQLFEAVDTSTLATQLAASSPDDDEIADIITLWSQQYPQIDVALREQLRLPHSTQSKGIGGTQPNPNTQERDAQEARETLLNAIRRFSELPKPAKTSANE